MDTEKSEAMRSEGELSNSDQDFIDEARKFTVQEDIVLLKGEKMVKKCAFTKQMHKLMGLLDDDQPSRKEVNKHIELFSAKADEAVHVINKLIECFKELKDLLNGKRMLLEREEIEIQFEETVQDAREYLLSRRGDASSVATSQVSEKLQRSQKNEIKARVKTDQLRAAVQNQEQKFEQIEAEYKKRIIEMQAQTLQDKQRLKLAEEELEGHRRNLDRQLEDELGVKRGRRVDPVIKREDTENEHKPRKSQQHDEAIFQMRKHSDGISSDRGSQLKRVSIPTFYGDKSLYEDWKATFISLVDNVDISKEYKLVHLKESLGGDALTDVQGLGHSAEAYEAAKEKLERNYGGERRRLKVVGEKVKKLNNMRDNNAKDFKRFADVLDIVVSNLSQANRSHELENGTLFDLIREKMTEKMVKEYVGWCNEHQYTKTVITLRKWVIKEFEEQTEAEESVRGVIQSSNRTMFGQQDEDRKGNMNDGKTRRRRSCCICSQEHAVWACEQFKTMSVDERWDNAQSNRLCYRCLGYNHVARICKRKEACSAGGCKQTHHPLLHREKKPEREDNQQDGRSEEGEADKDTSTEESVKTRSHVTMPATSNSNAFSQTRALRTVPVVLKNGKKRLKVNALLDDASTKTYLNADVAAELGLQGQVKTVNVSVLNGQTESFETIPVVCGLESTDGKVDVKINAFTTDQVTGDLQVIDWNKHAEKWTHLNDITFPSVGNHPVVDMLIGIDYADMHYSIKDVKGKQGEPIARLTPLGWTCICTPASEASYVTTNYQRNYFIRSRPDEGEATKVLRKFWEIEDVPTPQNPPLTKDEKIAKEKVQSSMVYTGDHYQVAIPWKTDHVMLPDNHKMALSRLESVEKKLMRNPEIARSYSDTLEKYEREGYITKVPKSEVNKHQRWYLPHFPVVRLDKETTKTRPVFDASAKYQGISLNDVIHQGPKLQNDLFKVLLRFRRRPVAVVCDIEGMYLRIELAEEDRPFHSFLWRDLKVDEEPDVYNFNRLVFGVNSSPYEAILVSQTHAEDNRDMYPLGAQAVLSSTYMDDSMDSVVNEEQGMSYMSS